MPNTNTQPGKELMLQRLGEGALANNSAAENFRNALKISSVLQANINAWTRALPKLSEQKVMASPPTLDVSTATQISGGIRWWAFGTEHASYTRGTRISSSGSVVSFDNVTGDNVGSKVGCSFGASVIHNGTEFEFSLGGSNTSFFIKIDDEYFSLTPTATEPSGATRFYRLTFSSAKRRRIEIIGSRIALASFFTGPSDTLIAAPIRGPRCIIVGDSFTAEQPNGWTTPFADAMGWDDVWASGVGGTGYFSTSSGTKLTFRQRLASDVIAFNPDIVFVFGSINDPGGSDITTESGLLFSQIKAALPDCLIIAGVNMKKGINSVSTSYLTYKNSLKASVESFGGIFLDIMELPTVPTGPSRSSTLKSNYAAGVTSIQSVTTLVPQATYQIGTTERLLVRSVTPAGANTFTLTFDGALQYAHTAGEAIQQVNGSLQTGSGNVGATTGFGNSDTWTSSDTVHLTPGVGYTGVGFALADQLKMKLLDLQSL